MISGHLVVTTKNVFKAAPLKYPELFQDSSRSTHSLTYAVKPEYTWVSWKFKFTIQESL